jgi:predicted nucleic acid-binding protein
VLYLARLTGVEVVSAIARRERSGHLSPAAAAAAAGKFITDFASLYRLVPMRAFLITAAMTLAQTHVLRGYDAVQLAAVLHVNTRRLAIGKAPVTLISADLELNAAAVAEGLTVDDPNAHPRTARKPLDHGGS